MAIGIDQPLNPQLFAELKARGYSDNEISAFIADSMGNAKRGPIIAPGAFGDEPTPAHQQFFNENMRQEYLKRLSDALRRR